jgi:septum formation protein
MPEAIILASGSASRAQMLRDAGVDIVVERPRVDEEAAKASLRMEGAPPRAQADALAEVKALSVSRIRPGLVIGADQMLALGERVFDKPQSREEARDQLRALSGQTHQLLNAAVVARDGVAIWRQITVPVLKMRPLSDAFIESYLDRVGEDAFTSVGAYKLEGLGGQLFESVSGDFFSVLGLPLLPLLAFLREQGALER